MNIGWIIALAVLGFGVSLKKQIAESKKDAASSFEGPIPEMEPPFNEDEENPFPTSFEEEERAAGYYSYETIDQPEQESLREEYEEDFDEEDEMIEQPIGRGFDLRQAIIYQTILHNDFLPSFNRN